MNNVLDEFICIIGHPTCPFATTFILHDNSISAVKAKLGRIAKENGYPIDKFLTVKSKNFIHLRVKGKWKVCVPIDKYKSLQ